MTRMMRMCLIAVVVALAGLSCAKKEPPQVENFSFTPPDGAVVTHIDLDLTVDFERQRLHGTASFDIDNEAGADKLYLDTWALLIDSVNLGDLGAQTDWTLGDSLALLGRPLIIDIKPGTRRVSVHYRTGEDARGLQWLRPEQTGDGKHPFLYTQSQAILARTWVPCQDHPAARITYRARIHTPPELIALMSARNPREKNPDGEYTFEMPQPIPTYLLALAVGDLAYGAVSDRCGVYASPAMLEQALWEFNDMERMAQVAEELYGPYRWEQFDVLVLPPSFPYGGMENPRLTFATPILVAGDRSLVSTIAHELAHSWSGNLVTNATWNDFWLNEGFTTYFTQRIMEELYGREVSEMHAMLGRERLEQAIEEAGPDKLTTALYVPLGDSDPDEELGTAAYQKGYLFLRLLEESFGRERFDAFLAEYFDTFAFETMTTEAFLEHMFTELFDGDDDMMEKLRVDEWVYRPGLPDNAPQAESPRFDRVDLAAAAFVAGKPAVEIESGEWTTQEWERFLAYFDQPLTVAQLDDLLRTFDFSSSNGVVQRSWYLVAIENEYDLEYPAIREYLMKVGRTWLIRPIYTELASTTRGMEFARDVYRDARPGYHSVTRTTIDGILGAPERAN